MSEFLNQFSENVQDTLKFVQGSLNILHQEVSIIKTRFCHPKEMEPTDTDTQFSAPRIDPKYLTDIDSDEKPIKAVANSSNIMVVKKFYTKNAITVSCETVIIEQKEFQSQKKQGYLAILGKLRECPNILKFFGVSTLKDSSTLREHEVLVFEWADMGNLKEVYEKYDIPWKTKISIAIDICRGITFLNSIDIFHHDIRCENVKMTNRLEPKLANFYFARMSVSISTNFEDGVLNIIHWLAPEKMYEHMSLNVKKRPYTQQCEIFSFGMMLWELCFEKVPYHGKDMGYITNHVTKGGRERIPTYSGSKEEKEIYSEFIKIIKMAWAHDPYERISIGRLYIMLLNMQKKYVPPGPMPDILPDKVLKLDNGITEELVMSDDEVLYIGEDDEIKVNDVEEILEVDQGIGLHITRDPAKRKVAWKCFVANATKGHSKAIFWQGYYLWEGYYTDEKRTSEQIMEDRNKALHLFKIAADDGIAEAQLRYSFALKELKQLKANDVYEEFMHYLRLAAENGNPVAMFNLSDIYINGKLREKKDIATGSINYFSNSIHNAALNKISALLQTNSFDSEYSQFYKIRNRGIDEKHYSTLTYCQFNRIISDLFIKRNAKTFSIQPYYQVYNSSLVIENNYSYLTFEFQSLRTKPNDTSNLLNNTLLQVREFNSDNEEQVQSLEYQTVSETINTVKTKLVVELNDGKTISIYKKDSLVSNYIVNAGDDEFLENLQKGIESLNKDNRLLKDYLSHQHKDIHENIRALQKDIENLETWHLRKEFGDY
ncbi:23565_t:CDS:2 [Gigaspora margarita]|uniref:23565_t:CDS:1 n=1 Tax=Gigaspora margarita TaxID=4874 RepID=A0ABM8W0Q8_GIGMA|nr:23565_t:CDS:2 [Gigaspora margarita]